MNCVCHIGATAGNPISIFPFDKFLIEMKMMVFGFCFSCQDIALDFLYGGAANASAIAPEMYTNHVFNGA